MVFNVYIVHRQYAYVLYTQYIQIGTLPFALRTHDRTVE